MGAADEWPFCSERPIFTTFCFNCTRAAFFLMRHGWMTATWWLIIGRRLRARNSTRNRVRQPGAWKLVCSFTCSRPDAQNTPRTIYFCLRYSCQRGNGGAHSARVIITAPLLPENYTAMYTDQHLTHPLLKLKICVTKRFLSVPGMLLGKGIDSGRA